MQRINKFIATLSFIGYIPIAPGTIASAIGVGVYLLVRNNSFIYVSVTLTFMLLGFWSATRAEKNFTVKDSPQIVIDEFTSMLLVYFFIPFNITFVITGFFLFRFFDVFKIPAIRRLENLPGGCGVMLDDIAAAILANIVLQVAAFAFR